MSYSFTTEPIDAGAGEGAISEAIDAAVYAKIGRRMVDDETSAVVAVAKRAVLGLVEVLGPGVTSYTVTIEGHHPTSRTMGNFWLGVDAVDYDE